MSDNGAEFNSGPLFIRNKGDGREIFRVEWGTGYILFIKERDLTPIAPFLLPKGNIIYENHKLSCCK